MAQGSGLPGRGAIQENRISVLLATSDLSLHGKTFNSEIKSQKRQEVESKATRNYKRAINYKSKAQTHNTANKHLLGGCRKPEAWRALET